MYDSITLFANTLNFLRKYNNSTEDAYFKKLLLNLLISFCWYIPITYQAMEISSNNLRINFS